MVGSRVANWRGGGEKLQRSTRASESVAESVEVRDGAKLRSDLWIRLRVKIHYSRARRLPRAFHFADVSSSPRSLHELLLSTKKNRVDKIRSRRYVVCATRCRRARECSRVLVASSPIRHLDYRRYDDDAGRSTANGELRAYIYFSDKTRKMTFWTGHSRYPSSRWRPRFHHEYAEASDVWKLTARGGNGRVLHVRPPVHSVAYERCFCFSLFLRISHGWRCVIPAARSLSSDSNFHRSPGLSPPQFHVGVAPIHPRISIHLPTYLPPRLSHHVEYLFHAVLEKKKTVRSYGRRRGGARWNGRAIAGDRAGRGRRGGARRWTRADEDSASFGFLCNVPAIVACRVNSFPRTRLADVLKINFISRQIFRSRVQFCTDCFKIMLSDGLICCLDI